MRRIGSRYLWVALMLIVTQASASVALSAENRALRLLLEKGVISQEEFDKALVEEQAEKKSNGLTKNGLTVKVGGFAEIDFIGDNTRSFEEIIGNRPVLRSATLDGANGRFATSPRNSRIIIDVRAPERNGIKTQYYGSIDFIGNEPDIGSAGTSELTVRTSPTARIFQMYFNVLTPVVDMKVGQDWSREAHMRSTKRNSKKSNGETKRQRSIRASDGGGDDFWVPSGHVQPTMVLSEEPRAGLGDNRRRSSLAELDTGG